MKQVKLNGVTMDAEAAKKIIADLQSQIDAPEEPVFWDGQLVVGRSLHTFALWQTSMNPDNWNPIQDPLILQFKPHTPGDPMPCDPDLEVRLMRRDGEIFSLYRADAGEWGRLTECNFEIIGWMPAKGWR